MQASLQRFSFQAMGSPCEIQLCLGSRLEAGKINRVLRRELTRLENKYSRFIPESFLSEINRSAGSGRGIKIDRETRALFDHASSCYEQSHGLFDVTAGILNRAWDFRAGIVPEAARLEALLPLVGFRRLQWRGGRLYLPAGMEIDFGGIVKEYAADTVAGLARGLGAAHGLVNLGGDFSVIGPRPDGRAWPIAVADPNRPESAVARIALKEGGLATSGDYARCFVHEGRRYSHILNPRTGWPADGLRAVSVAAGLCTVAGSMATIALLMDERQGLQWLMDSQMPYIAVNRDGGIVRNRDRDRSGTAREFA